MKDNMTGNLSATQFKDREHSQLFLIRLWAEQGNDGSDSEGSEDSGGNSTQIEWCGKLQHVVSGQARYFRGCPQLTDILLEMMQEQG